MGVGRITWLALLLLLPVVVVVVVVLECTQVLVFRHAARVHGACVGGCEKRAREEGRKMGRGWSLESLLIASGLVRRDHDSANVR